MFIITTIYHHNTVLHTRNALVRNLQKSHMCFIKPETLIARAGL